MPLAYDAGLRWLLEHSADMLTLYDASGALTYGSPSVQRNTGFSIEDLAGYAISEFTHPDDRERARDAFTTAYASPGVSVPLLNRQRYKDGTWHWLEGTVTNLLHEPDVCAVVCTYRDVTDRHQAEENLLKSQSMMVTAEHIAGFGSWKFVMTDLARLEGNALGWSDQVFRIFGYRPGEIEVTIENFFNAIHPDDRVRARAAWMMSLSTHTKISFDHRIIRPDGTIRWVHEEAAVDKDTSAGNQVGQMLPVTGTVRDITELKLAEVNRAEAVKALVGRNADLERFAFLVSHDLRSPVATILGLAGLLQEEKLDEDMRNEFIEGLVFSVKKLNDAITDLDTILEGKTYAPEKHAAVQFEDLVHDVSHLLGLRPDDITITTDFSAAESIRTLSSFMSSIFQNLIENSVKYRRPDTQATLHISSLRTARAVMISFSDNCLGIDLVKHGDDIFAMRQRFHSHIKGSGMGLYMVKTQVEALGGTIHVRSTVNEGTEFILEFTL